MTVDWFPCQFVGVYAGLLAVVTSSTCSPPLAVRAAPASENGPSYVIPRFRASDPKMKEEFNMKPADKTKNKSLFEPGSCKCGVPNCPGHGSGQMARSTFPGHPKGHLVDQPAQAVDELGFLLSDLLRLD